MLPPRRSGHFSVSAARRDHRATAASRFQMPAGRDAAELIGAGELPEDGVPLYETAPPRCQSQPLRAARAAGQHRSRSPLGGDRPHEVSGKAGRATSSVNSPIAWVLTVWLPLVPGLLMLRRWRARRGV
jgi:hypothetical protein